MRKYFKFLFLSFLSLSILVIAGIGFVIPNAGLANDRGFLVDMLGCNRKVMDGMRSSNSCLFADNNTVFILVGGSDDENVKNLFRSIELKLWKQ